MIRGGKHSAPSSSLRSRPRTRHPSFYQDNNSQQSTRLSSILSSIRSIAVNMPNASILVSAAPYHILSYGTLLGTEVFQSFIAGIVSFRALPRAQFATLQTALFPVYFSMQSALPVLMALTYPAERTAIGTIPSGMSGVFHEQNRLHVLTPLAIILVTALANKLYIQPETVKCMRERKHQETRDGKKSYDPPPHSDPMQALNKKFMYLHSSSALVNIFGCIATVWYGFTLAERMV